MKKLTKMLVLGGFLGLMSVSLFGKKSFNTALKDFQTKGKVLEAEMTKIDPAASEEVAMRRIFYPYVKDVLTALKNLDKKGVFFKEIFQFRKDMQPQVRAYLKAVGNRYKNVLEKYNNMLALATKHKFGAWAIALLSYDLTKKKPESAEAQNVRGFVDKLKKNYK